MSEIQEDLIVSHVKGIVLMLDGDEAGREATKTNAAKLVQRMSVRVISLPDGREPDQLSSEELKAVLGSL